MHSHLVSSTVRICRKSWSLIVFARHPQAPRAELAKRQTLLLKSFLQQLQSLRPDAVQFLQFAGRDLRKLLELGISGGCQRPGSRCPILLGGPEPDVVMRWIVSARAQAARPKAAQRAATWPSGRTSASAAMTVVPRPVSATPEE